MMTPQEAAARVFTKASFGGYNIQQVDAFLDSLIEDYSALHQENTVLKSKMKLLVDKIEEYRATEDAMRRTLHFAQKKAEEMVQEGEAQKEEAIQSALEEAQRQGDELRVQIQEEVDTQQAHLDAIRTDLANEEARLRAARTSTTAYVAKLKELYTKELEYIGSLSSLTAEDLDLAALAQEQAENPNAAQTPEPAAGEAGTQPEGGSGDTRDFDQIKFDEDSTEG